MPTPTNLKILSKTNIKRPWTKIIEIATSMVGTMIGIDNLVTKSVETTAGIDVFEDIKEIKIHEMVNNVIHETNEIMISEIDLTVVNNTNIHETNEIMISEINLTDVINTNKVETNKIKIDEIAINIAINEIAINQTVINETNKTPMSFFCMIPWDTKSPKEL